MDPFNKTNNNILQNAVDQGYGAFDDAMAGVIAAYGFSPLWRAIMVLSIAGMKQVGVARFLGISRVTVYNAHKDDRFAECLDKLTIMKMEKVSDIVKQVRDGFQSNSLKAQEILADIMNDDNASETARISAAREILDRAGHKPPDKIELTGNQITQLRIKDMGYDREDDPYYKLSKKVGKKPEERLEGILQRDNESFMQGVLVEDDFEGFGEDDE